MTDNKQIVKLKSKTSIPQNDNSCHFRAIRVRNIVKKDIINLLHLQNPFTLTTGFDRANLKFSVQIPENKNKYILNFLQNQNDIPGIIYCATRKLVDNLFEKLTECGYKVSWWNE